MNVVNLPSARAVSIGRSLWNETAGAPPPGGAFAGSIEVETVVVGAGVAGLSTALHLAREGRSVAVLEAEERPDAATGASAGIIAPQLVRKSPKDVLRLLGANAGDRLLRAVAESGRYTFGLIREESLECDASQAGFLAPFFGSPRQPAKTVEEWRPYRDDLDLLDGAATEALSGCHGYSGAILDRSGGQIHPVAYADGLARRAVNYGASIYRSSPAQGLERHGASWRVRTPQGQVCAKTVVICANGGAARLHPRLAHTTLPLPVCEVATQPLAPELRAAILAQGHALTDLSTDIFSIRLDAAGRLVTACPAPDRLDYGALNSAINRRLASMLPAWRETPLEFAWVGVAWLNPDLLPRLVKVEDGLVAVQTCNGRGLGMSGLAGREIARWIASDGAEEPLLAFVSPKPVAGFSLARHIPRLVHGAARIRQALFHRP